MLRSFTNFVTILLFPALIKNGTHIENPNKLNGQNDATESNKTGPNYYEKILINYKNYESTKANLNSSLFELCVNNLSVGYYNYFEFSLKNLNPSVLRSLNFKYLNENENSAYLVLETYYKNLIIHNNCIWLKIDNQTEFQLNFESKNVSKKYFLSSQRLILKFNICSSYPDIVFKVYRYINNNNFYSSINTRISNTLNGTLLANKYRLIFFKTGLSFNQADLECSQNEGQLLDTSLIKIIPTFKIAEFFKSLPKLNMDISFEISNSLSNIKNCTKISYEESYDTQMYYQYVFNQTYLINSIFVKSKIKISKNLTCDTNITYICIKNGTRNDYYFYTYGVYEEISVLNKESKYKSLWISFLIVIGLLFFILASYFIKKRILIKNKPSSNNTNLALKSFKYFQNEESFHHSQNGCKPNVYVLENSYAIEQSTQNANQQANGFENVYENPYDSENFRSAYFSAQSYITFSKTSETELNANYKDLSFDENYSEVFDAKYKN